MVGSITLAAQGPIFEAATRFEDWFARTIIPLSVLQPEDVIMRHLTLLAVLAGSMKC
jgi:hypothetical protein